MIVAVMVVVMVMGLATMPDCQRRHAVPETGLEYQHHALVVVVVVVVVVLLLPLPRKKQDLQQEEKPGQSDGGNSGDGEM